ncbi:DUF6192 family protein [Streptomyces canus]|uniref:DUF6192 family protein n=1 Tax=Streptomyces canus TaxID=58343 RepID=UPI00371C406B
MARAPAFAHGHALLCALPVAATCVIDPPASAQPAGQEFTDDKRETVRRQISRVRVAAGRLEVNLGNGEFTLDEQLPQLLKSE